MQYNDKLFNQVAQPRIKKFYEAHKDIFLAQAMDLKDLLQEMRIELWQILLKFNNLSDDGLLKLTNKILSRKLIDEKRFGFKHMKKEEMKIEDGIKERTIVGHMPQFVDIDSVNEVDLVNTKEADNIRNKMLLDIVKDKVTDKEYQLLLDFVQGYTAEELACKKLICEFREVCNIHNNPDNYLNNQSHIGRFIYKAHCKYYNRLNTQATIFKKLKRRAIAKAKKV